MIKMQHIKIKIKTSNDFIFNLMLFYFLKEFKGLTEEDKRDMEGIRRKLMRNLRILNLIENIMGKIAKELAVPKKEGRVKFSWNVHLKGGVIIFDLMGTPEEVKNWTKQSLLSRVLMKSYKKFVEIEVKKFEKGKK